MARRGLLGSLIPTVKRDAQDNEMFPLDGMLFSVPSITGLVINQQTALQATAVMACTSTLSEDVSKMTPGLFRKVDIEGYKGGGRQKVDDHPIARLLVKPNTWQTWPEFCRFMVVAYLLRGNAYAVILRDRRGDPVMFVPINPDRVALWEAPGGSLFWQVSRAGLHELAILKDQPFLIPYDDVFHLKDLSANGLVGMSRISLAREAIGLALGQEQQYARLMGNGARPSGILSTEKNMSPEAADRNKERWQQAHAGLLRGGGTAILEGGLKWTPLSLSAVDLQFLQLRQFQLAEIARMFRVPLHMIGDLSRGTFNNITQQSQEYRNNTLTSHSDIWEKRFAFQFNLDAENLFVDFDESALLKADITARYGAYRVGIMTEFLERNECRIAEGLDPKPEGKGLRTVSTAGGAGSDLSGEAPDGAGKPSEDGKHTPEPEVGPDAAPGV